MNSEKRIQTDAAPPGGAAQRAAERNGVAGAPRSRITTVSHTLSSERAERLREFAFRQRISESSVIEFALHQFFESGNDEELGAHLRARGAALRRKS